jgi:hypothetical protein
MQTDTARPTETKTRMRVGGNEKGRKCQGNDGQGNGKKTSIEIIPLTIIPLTNLLGKRVQCNS